MSWDAMLVAADDHDRIVALGWNYTHNCNRMGDAAMAATGRASRTSWWRVLHGLPGPAGAEFLGAILAELRGDPGRYRAMNPPNGWGDYDSFVEVLEAMHAGVPEWPITTWAVHG